MITAVRRWLPWTRPQVASDRPYQWVIEPVREGFFARTKEFWRYRRILWFLCSRALKSRYEGMTLGPLWLFVRPLAPIFIGAFVFGRLLGMPSDGVPYFLFFLTGQAAWHVFDRSLMMVTRGLSINQGILKKVYFPRLMAPISAASIGLTYFAAFMAMLIVAAFFYLFKDGIWYLQAGPQLLLAPLSALLALILAIGVGLFATIWQTRFREMRYTIRYFTQFWMYLTPVFYPLSQVPPQYRWIMYVNPMGPIVETFKWSMLGIGELPVVPLGCSVVITLVVLLAGIWYFSWAEAGAIDKM
jgi:lipopolysaccharide transport system permease protein